MSWDQIRGHDALVQSFEHVVRAGRLGHAYLFIGPAGIGKRLFAGELAKALLCENPPPDRLAACDQCDACHQVIAGTHPDFFAVARPEENLDLPIDVMRELCRLLSLKPARGRRKIAIVDDADDLNDASANAFLKTLEEPSPGSVLILISARPELQKETIVSRCQMVRFAPLGLDLVADVLRAHGLTDATMIERLARLSDGSPGQALALADPALWEFRRVLLTGLTRNPPDTVRLAKQWTEFLEEAGKEASVQRRRAALALRLLIEFLGDAMRVSLGGTPRLTDADDLGPLRELATRAGPDRLLDLLERCVEGDAHIDRRVQLVLALEALVDSLGQKLQAG